MMKKNVKIKKIIHAGIVLSGNLLATEEEKAERHEDLPFDTFCFTLHCSIDQSRISNGRRAHCIINPNSQDPNPKF